MGGIKIDTGGGGIAIGDGALALGVGSHVNYGHASGKGLSAPELADLVSRLGAVKAALLGAGVANAANWAARIGELEQAALNRGGRLARAPARQLLAQIGAAAGNDSSVQDALGKAGECFGRASEPADVFVSYKRDDRARVLPLVEALRSLQIKCWIDDALAPGESFTDDITEQIDQCRAQIVCWSKGAIASDWVRGEAELGRGRGILISVVLEPCRISPPFNMLHAEDLSGWRGDLDHPALAKVLEALGRKLLRPGLASLAAVLKAGDAAALATWRRTHPDDPYLVGNQP